MLTLMSLLVMYDHCLSVYFCLRTPESVKLMLKIHTQILHSYQVHCLTLWNLKALFVTVDHQS